MVIAKKRSHNSLLHHSIVFGMFDGVKISHCILSGKFYRISKDDCHDNYLKKWKNLSFQRKRKFFSTFRIFNILLSSGFEVVESLVQHAEAITSSHNVARILFY